MINLGTVDPGSTIYVPFESFASSTGAPITITGLATSDIQVFKDGSMTQRASASGFTLLDTDGIDLDGITGIHGFSIDLSDNTTADFWAAGSRYIVVVSTITVDSQTMSFIAATFRIGKSGALLDTTIATLASQTSFTLTSGPAEDDALNGHWAIIHDAASAVQFARVLILDYTGSTKTVTLAAGATFTVAAKDNISIMGMAPLQPVTLGNKLTVDSANFCAADILRINSDADVKDYLVDLLSNGWDNTNNWMRSNEVAISGDATAADNLEAMVDGTGGVPLKVTSFTITDGLIISATTGNRPGISATGDGSAAGVIIKSGSSSADAALICQAQGANDNAIRLIATGTRHGIYATGGDTGHGVYLTGGSTSGDGARLEATASGHGLNAIGIGSGKYDINAGSLGTLFSVLTVSGATTFTGAIAAANASNNIVGIDVAKISGDTTAADNAEAFFDGTGYAGTNNVIPTVTTITNEVKTGRTIKRIAPGGGGDYTSLSAAITALASNAGVIELVCSAGNIGGGNLHSLTSASEVILRSDTLSRHRHDTAQPLSETAYFASNLVYSPTGSGPAKVRIEGLRSSGVSVGLVVAVDAAAKTYDLELVDNLWNNSGGVGTGLDQIYVTVVDGTLNVLATGNTHFFTTTGSAKGYAIYVTATTDGADAARINVRAYNNTGNTDVASRVVDGIAFGAEVPGGGTGVIFADVRNNLVLGVEGSGTTGAINIQDVGGTTTLTGSHNATNDSSAAANGLTSGLTSVVAADVLSSPTTSNVQLSTATTRDAGYALDPVLLNGRVKSGSVWDIGSHEFQAGLSATQLGYVNTSLSTLATSNALASLVSTVGAAGAGLTAITGLITDIYHADIYYTRDDAGAEDTYKAVWFKNGIRITSGITSPTIQVVKEADGSDLIASSAMTEIGTTEAFKYTATTTARQTAGESCLVIVGATIDGSSRTFIRSLGRDSTA